MKKIIFLIVAAVMSAVSATSAWATVYYRSPDVVTDLDFPAAWLVYKGTGDMNDIANYERPAEGYELPDTGDTVRWLGNGATWTSAFTSDTGNVLSRDVAWYGLQLDALQQTGYILNAGGFTLSLGAGGIELMRASVASSFMTFSNGGMLISANQNWALFNGQATKFSLAGTAWVDMNGKTVTMAGGGLNVGDMNATDFRTIAPTFRNTGVFKVNVGDFFTTLNSCQYDYETSSGVIIALNGNANADESIARYAYRGSTAVYADKDAIDMTPIRLDTPASVNQANGVVTFYNIMQTINGSQMQNVVYGGKLSGTGGLEIMVTPNCSISMVSDNRSFAGQIRLTGVNTGSDGKVWVGNDYALGVGILYLGQYNGATHMSRIGALQNVTLKNDEVHIRDFMVVGENNLSFHGTFYTTTGATSVTITNSLTSDARLTFNGNFFGRKEGLDYSSPTITFNGTGTTVFNGKIYDNIQQLRYDGIRNIAVSGCTLILNGANEYTGTTTVSSGGKLYINGTQLGRTWPVVLSTVGAFTAEAGTTFGGYGIIGGVVSVAGTLDVLSHETKSLTFQKGLTLSGNLLLQPEASAFVTGGNLILETGWVFSLGGKAADWFEDAAASTLVFTFVPGVGNLIATPTSLNLYGLNGSFFVDDTAGQVWLMGIATTIPEPTAIALLASGGLSLAALRRSRRKKNS